MLSLLRVALLASLANCAPKRIRPVDPPSTGSATVTPDAAVAEADTPEHDLEPADDDPKHPWGADSLARLPKVDFVAPYAKTSDAAKTRGASALAADAATRDAAKDWSGAEQKYTAALAIDPGYIEARYGLARAYARLGSGDRALALLLELRRVKKCDECMAAVHRARWEDGWESLWDRVAFSRIGYRLQGSAWAETATCVAGLEQRALWKESGEFACLRNGKLHGRYAQTGSADWGGHGTATTYGEYRDGAKHGLWAQTSSNGATEHYTTEVGAYVDDVKHGLWQKTEASRGGGGIYVEKWVRGKREGFVRTRSEVVSHDENGNSPTRFPGPIKETSYANDVLHGPTRTWLADFRLLTEGAHRQGKKHGRWTTYGDDGKPMTETEYFDNHKHGAWVLRTSAGEKLYTGTWDRGFPIGEHTYWYAGKRLGTATIKNLTGDWVEYDGKALVEKGRYVNGKRDGRWTFREDASWHDGRYAAGRRTGTWTVTSFDDRTKQRQGPYVDDREHGAWTYWQDTKVRAKGSFTRGDPDGKWSVFGESGRVEQSLVFRAGKLVKVDGKPATEIQQKNFETSMFATLPRVISSDPPITFPGDPEPP